MPKPLIGSQVLDDTFEKLKDQVQDAGRALTGQDSTSSRDAGLRGASSEDLGIEQLAGQSGGVGSRSVGQAQKQGLTPQQVAEKRAEEKRAYEFHEQRIKEWEGHYKQAQQEKEMKEKQAEEQAQAQKQQEIVQLQEEESKAAALGSQKSSKPKGPGSAFVTQSTKSQTEFSKQATQ